MTLSELTRATGLPKSTVHRLLAKLLELDVIELTPSGYKIGLRLVQLSATTPAAVMRDIALPHMASLQRWSGRTIGLFLLRDLDVVLLENLGPTVSNWTVGTRRSALTTAAGRAILAHADADGLAHDLGSAPGPGRPTEASRRRLQQELKQIRSEGLAHAFEDPVHWLATPLVVSKVAVGALTVAWMGEPAVDARLEMAMRSVTVQLTNDLKAHKQQHERWFPKSEPLSP